MKEKLSPLVQNVAEIVADRMEEILQCFKPGALITVLVRNPSKPDGTQDFVLSNDSLHNAIKALNQRIDGDSLTGHV